MGGSSKRVTVGYRYYMGLHMAICHGPVDAVREIRAGGRVAWSGEVTGSTRIRIDRPGLWGGEKREGGLVGDLDIMMGEPTQAPNDYLSAQLGTPQPAYRGVLSLVWRGGQVAAMNPYLKPWHVTVTRLPARDWQSAYAEPSPGDANPAHILREAITSTTWGMGYPEHMIDEASFAAAAQQLHAEGCGLSLIYRQQGSIEALIQQVLDHIGGALRQDPVSGLWQLKLIRDDYDIDDLPVLDPSSAVLESYERAAYGEAPNEITVLYTDPDTLEETAVTVQSIAHIDTQGAVISDTRRYPGIRSHAIAQRVAMRDLRAATTPLARVRLRARRGYDLLPGDPFVLRWPDYGIDALVCRVGRISIGSLTDGEYTIDAAEDVFGLPDASYVEQQPIGWIDPSRPPAPAPMQRAEELPWWEIARALTAAELDYLPDDVGYVRAWGSRPSADAVSYELLTTAGGEYETRATGDWPPYLEITEALPRAASDITVTYGAAYHADLISVGSYGIIGDEYVVVLAIDTIAQTITLGRAVHDTVPQPHEAGDILWIIDDYGAVDETEWVDGETVSAKILPTTSQGTLDASQATPMQVEITARAHRPYPPGRLRYDGDDYPTTQAGGGIALTWAHRDRTQQTADIIPQSAGDIGPEPGTTYHLTILGEDDQVLVDQSGLTGTSYTLTEADELSQYGVPVPVSDEITTGAASQPVRPQARVTIRLAAERDGLSSYQRHELTVQRIGWGMAWGDYYGGSEPQD